MPIYEYRCIDCKKRSTILILKPGQSQISCKHCKSHNLERIMSRFAAPKSEEARMEALSDPSKFAGLDENDPKSMAKFMKKMGREMGEDVGDDFDEALEGMGNEEMESSLPEMD